MDGWMDGWMCGWMDVMLATFRAAGPKPAAATTTTTSIISISIISMSWHAVRAGGPLVAATRANILSSTLLNNR